LQHWFEQLQLQDVKALLLVGAGGFISSVLCYLVSGWVFRFLGNRGSGWGR
jgi:hypothetical protein